MKYVFTVRAEIEACDERDARLTFDRMREACLPSDHGVVLFDAQLSYLEHNGERWVKGKVTMTP